MKSVSAACLKRFAYNSDLLLIGNGYTYQGSIQALQLTGETLTVTFERIAERTPAIDLGLATKPLTVINKGGYRWSPVHTSEYTMTFDGVKKQSAGDGELRVTTQRGEFIILLAEEHGARLNYAVLFQVQPAGT